MKRCYFTGMRDIFDSELIELLKDECEKVIINEDLVEFWFLYGEHDSYIGSCICLATWLRTKYPEKVRIVRVFDPVKMTSLMIGIERLIIRDFLDAFLIGMSLHRLWMRALQKLRWHLCSKPTRLKDGFFGKWMSCLLIITLTLKIA